MVNESHDEFLLGLKFIWDSRGNPNPEERMREDLHVSMSAPAIFPVGPKWIRTNFP